MNKILIVTRFCNSDRSFDVEEYPIEYASKQGFLASLVDEDHSIVVKLKVD